ncbi:phosphoribosyl-AMP cyclohydrolase [Candidatus Gottesmanbacteria bacterium]|nr:phosphoribosyl-AMP cyclohydrolase [Candidatus Gottesmanbacteria bacterium]
MKKMNFPRSDLLIPTVIQDAKTLEILMLGYMNRRSFNKTLKEGQVYFWSRSRRKIWKKGEISGNKLGVKAIFSDCDKDALLIKVKLIGKNVCHTGNKSCFYRKIL